MTSPGAFVPLATLEMWLKHMEEDWLQLDYEFGPAKDGLEGMIERGKEPEIASLRMFVEIAKKTPDAGELEQMGADAKRYRWLRDGNAYAPEEAGVLGGEALDKLIDEAMPNGSWWK